MADDHAHPHDLIKSIRREGKAVVLELSGEIDMHHCMKLRDKFVDLLRDKPPVLVVNLSEVGFMDSSGAATLVGALKLCRRIGCQLRLVGLTERVRNVFEICRLESVFQFYEDEAEALS